VFVQSLHIYLGMFTGTTRNDCPTFFMYVQHQFRCLFEAVPEEFLKDPSYVGHEVDRIIPDDHDPGPIKVDRLVGLDIGHR